MPIVGWFCPGCKRQVGLDHFETTPCGKVVHPDYAAAVLHQDDARYTDSAVTVTAGLGCPRSRALEKELGVYVNPLAYNAQLTGKAWDYMMEDGAQWVIAESEDTSHNAKVQLTGTIAGVMVQGEIDRVRMVVGEDGEPVLTIEDHKNNNNFVAKWLKSEGVKPENVVQTSVYAELYHQVYGVRPMQGAIWHHFAGAAKAWPDSVVMPFFYELWELERCLEFHPFNGGLTYLEILQQAAGFEATKQKVLADGTAANNPETLPNLAVGLPLVGATMNFGGKSSYCDYCAVQGLCVELATGSPF